MSITKAFRSRIFLLVLGLAAAAGSAPSPAAGAADVELAVVVHPDLEVEGVSFADLKKILLGDRQFWSSGERVTLLVQAPKSPEREIILKKIYRMTEAQFERYWIQKVFQADVSTGPKIVVSNAMAVNLVAGIPGAVALVNAGEVPDGLRVLEVDGRSPGEAGYELR